jgi:flagellar motor protein MotB
MIQPPHRRARQPTATAEAGEGYLASVSDLMIGVLFVFLLILMAYVLQFRDASERNARAEQQARELGNTLKAALVGAQADLAQAQADAARARRDAAAQAAAIARAELTLQQLADSRVALARTQADLAQAQAALAQARAAAAQADQQRQQIAEQARTARAQLAARIDAIAAGITAANNMRAVFLSNVRARLEREGVAVAIDEANGILRLGESVTFAPLSAELSDMPDPRNPFRSSPRQAVRRVAAILMEHLPCYAVAATSLTPCAPGLTPIVDAVYIEGHTDDDPVLDTSHFANNRRLSSARAEVTYDAMVSDQPRLAELRNTRGEKILSLSAYGEDRPVARGDKAANRRIDIRFNLTPVSSDQVRALQDNAAGR